MPSFLHNLFRRLSPRSKPGSPQAYLSAFGKHPGWDDHIDDLGLETPQLIHLKRFLYVEGIAGNIDSGAWEALPQEQQLPEFRHVFLWRTGETSIVGRFWSSRDGKGRSRYPMVLCAQCDNVPTEWAIQHVLPRLQILEAHCLQTTDASQVRKLVDQAREQLRCELASAPTTGGQPCHPCLPPEILACPAMGPDLRGLLLILYQVERELSAFRPRHLDLSNPPSARHLRVPPCHAEPASAISLWLRFLLAELDETCPLFIALPVAGSWVDLIVGQPTVPLLFCLRAGARKLPLTTEIPYNLDPEFVRQTTSRITSARSRI